MEFDYKTRRTTYFLENLKKRNSFYFLDLIISDSLPAEKYSFTEPTLLIDMTKLYAPFGDLAYLRK